MPVLTRAAFETIGNHTLPACSCDARPFAWQALFEGSGLIKVWLKIVRTDPECPHTHRRWMAGCLGAFDRETDRTGIIMNGERFVTSVSRADSPLGSALRRATEEQAPPKPTDKHTKKMARKPRLNFRIGADPEFNIHLQGTRLDASKLMRQTLGERLPPVDMGWKVGNAGVIGYDGNAATAELRPSPSDRPAELVANIGRLVGELAKDVRFVELRTTSESAPVGGHVHLDIPARMSGERADALGRKLASLYVPLLLGEDETNLSIRGQTRYSKLFTFHVEHQEKGRTLEFRAPSAEWLTTPKVAEAVLSYLGVCWTEILADTPALKKLDRMFLRDSGDADSVAKMAARDYCGFLSAATRHVRPHIRNFRAYGKFREQVELALSPKRMLAEKEKAGFDMMSGWRLNEDVRRPTKRAVMSRKRVNGRLDEMGADADRLKAYVAIPYRNDMNVSLFADALARRVVAYGWKLRNGYYLFGSKRGVGTVAADADLTLYRGADALVTTDDWGALSTEMTKMHRNLVEKAHTGAMPAKRRIAIGISREDRERRSVRDVMGLISDLEAGRLKGTPAKDLKLKRRTADNGNGTVAEAYGVMPSGPS